MILERATNSNPFFSPQSTHFLRRAKTRRFFFPEFLNFDQGRKLCFNGMDRFPSGSG